MKNFLPYLQIAVSIVLILLILLQQRGEALGSAFGGTGGFYATRRGIQKTIFRITIGAAAAFIVLAILNLIL